MAEIDFWTHVRRQTERIVNFKPQTAEEEGLNTTQLIADKLEGILRELCDESCVFPFVSSDGEGGIVATWYAGEFTLEILVDTDDDVLITTDSPRDSLRVGLLKEFDQIQLRAHIRVLSRYVKRVNPKWRELIQD